MYPNYLKPLFYTNSFIISSIYTPPYFSNSFVI